MHFSTPFFGYGCPDPLPMTQLFQSFDYPSVRRGRQIYTEVFAPCHALDGLVFRHLQEFMTVEEVKALASEHEIANITWMVAQPFPVYTPEGNPEIRPGMLNDKLPAPYKNKAEAKFSNGGAAPPNLATITKARHGGENYIFALLTSYGRELPAGVTCPRDGLFWNPYFPGGFLAMPTPLSEGMVDFEDETPATVAQMSKDVVVFLAWCADPGYTENKYMLMKLMVTFWTMIPFWQYWANQRINPYMRRRRTKIWRMGTL